MPASASSAVPSSQLALRADDLLVETIDGLFANNCIPERLAAAETANGFDAALWSLLVENGLTLVGLPESIGGSGGTLHDAIAIVRASGFHAAPVPIADSIAAAFVCAGAGLSIPSGVLAFAISEGPATSDRTVRVPWGGAAEHLLAVSADGVATVPVSPEIIVARGHNYAGEPWIDVASSIFTSGNRIVSEHVTPQPTRATAALFRSAAIAGALDRTVELCLQYANEREQFGKPIGKFQILQHYLSEMAGESAATGAAVDNAVDVISAHMGLEEAVLASAAAKAYAGRAVATVTRLAHQLHGAIGYTDEHRLQFWTRRLWAWRDEFGSESEWAAVLGRAVASSGGAALWPRITSWPPAR
jgi:acyl-CoA dehydrogenase